MKEQTISNLKKLKSFHNGSYGADIDKAIQALEQQPCEDCVSRNVLKRAISELTYWHPTTDGRLEVGGSFDKTVYKVEDVWRLTRVLPSVTTQLKRGKWIHNNCSICDYNVNPWNHTPYCPNCGAKMEVEE